MGFCTEEEAKHFLEVLPTFEKMMVDSGIFLINIGLRSVRKSRPAGWRAALMTGARYGTLPMDLQSYDRWDEYTGPVTKCLRRPTRRGHRGMWRNRTTRGARRLNIIQHLLSKIPYKKVSHDKVKLPKRQNG